MGRKAPHHVVSSILPPALLARLDTAARWAGKTRSATIREILEGKLDARLLPDQPAPLPGYGDVLL